MTTNGVIVTYNRKKLLLNCVKSVLRQSIPVNQLYIIDNASVDGTKRHLIDNGLVSDRADRPVKIGDTFVHYIRMDKNIGGAGGFCEGMKLACSSGPDHVWIMDDDGYPSENCLEKQLELANTFDYVMPISLDTEKRDLLTWYIRKRDNRRTRSYRELRNSFESGIMDRAVPFNGLLLSKHIIEKVGYPKSEMFIWGDDFEHQYRCVKAGFKPVTALDAVFYHPEDKADHHKIFLGTIPVNYSDSKLRFTCLIRNSTYNYWNYKGKYFIFLKLLIYTWFFLIYKKFAFKEYLYYLRCVKDGIKGDFTRHLRFLE